MGIIIENFSGAMPVWLHFEQVSVVPVNPEFNDYADKVCSTLRAVGIRAKAYTDDDNMKNKIKAISPFKVPYILVVGANEAAEESVTVRFRFSTGKQQQTMKLSEFKDYILDKVATHAIES